MTKKRVAVLGSSGQIGAYLGYRISVRKVAL